MATKEFRQLFGVASDWLLFPFGPIPRANTAFLCPSPTHPALCSSSSDKTKSPSPLQAAGLWASKPSGSWDSDERALRGLPMAECPAPLNPRLAALGPAVPQGLLPPLPHKTPIVSSAARETYANPQDPLSFPLLLACLKHTQVLREWSRAGPEWPDLGPTFCRALFHLLFRTTLVADSTAYLLPLPLFHLF